MSLTLGGKSQTRPDVFVFEVGKICQEFVLSHARGQILKHVYDGDA